MCVVLSSVDSKLVCTECGICRARENMQFKKVKKEITNCKKRDFVQTCRFYAKNRVFLQIERNVVQKSTWMHKF